MHTRVVSLRWRCPQHRHRLAARLIPSFNGRDETRCEREGGYGLFQWSHQAVLPDKNAIGAVVLVVVMWLDMADALLAAIVLIVSIVVQMHRRQHYHWQIYG